MFHVEHLRTDVLHHFWRLRAGDQHLNTRADKLRNHRPLVALVELGRQVVKADDGPLVAAQCVKLSLSEDAGHCRQLLLAT